MGSKTLQTLFVAMLCHAAAAAQEAQVGGRVGDTHGAPIAGATVVIRGTTTGTVTDADGRYTLRVPADAWLRFSFLGYAAQEAQVGGRTTIDITLLPDATELEDVVVTALGIRRQEKALAYSVQQVGGDELTAVRDANFANSLVGKVAGVQINSASSGAGGTVKIVMRGTKSIEKGNNVLYVIDGIPMYNRSFSGGGGTYGGVAGSESSADLNPDDIESVNVLTGPSAAALYGSDAANGAIIINTKRGGRERTTVTLSNSTMFHRVTMLPRMQSKYGTSSGLMNWGDAVESNFDAEKFFRTGTSVISTVSLSTGNEKNQAYVSASATNAQGTIWRDSYDRYNFTGRNTTTLFDGRLALDFGASYIVQKDRNKVAQGKYYNPLPALYLFPRSDNFDDVRNYERFSPALGVMAQYWPYGEGTHSLQNPYWIQNRMYRATDKRRYMLNASLRWKIAEWVDVGARVRLDNSQYRFTHKYYATTLTTLAGVNGTYRDQTQTDNTLYGDVMVNFDKTFADDWTVKANVGASVNDQRYEFLGGGVDLLIPNFFSMNNSNRADNSVGVDGWRDQVQSVFGSAEVGWRGTVFLTVTGRNDWDSKLAFSAQSSFFYPSVGLSGVVSDLLPMPDALSYLKARASYSQVASAFGRYLSNPSYTYNSQTRTWSRPNTAPLDNMKPEDTKSWEVGLNARVLGNISLDATFYQSNTYHQTIYAAAASSSLYSSRIEQTGNVENRGVELSLGYSGAWGPWSLSSTLTYTLNRNTVRRLSESSLNDQGEPEIQKAYLGAASVAPQVILREGGTMSDVYVRHELARTGNGHILVDSNGNLSMMQTEARKVGSLAPRYNLGWNSGVGWNGVSLGLVVTARVGGLCYSATQGILDYYGASQATADARDRGGVDVNYGKIAAQNYYQAISTAEGGFGAYYLYSATNVRLQEVSLGYTLPRRWFADKMELSLGFVSRNLLMIYCKAPFDPEVSGDTSSSYYQSVDYFMQPTTRNFGFNISIKN